MSDNQSSLKSHKRIVVKIGSNVIASHGTGFNERRIEGISTEIAELIGEGRELFLVSSGAILCGVEKLGLTSLPKTLPMKQAAAAVGQSQLMWAYERLFGRHKIKVGQVLLTREDIANRRRFLNARNTLLTLLENQILPIINENDTVATDEINLGDNDMLAGQVAHLVDASLLIVLSDVDGLYTKDPRKDKTARRISVVEEVTMEIEKIAGHKGNPGGTGGMASKVATAKTAAAFGVTTLILNGTCPGLIKRALHGEGDEMGTLFLPRQTKRSSKKHWIAQSLKAKGVLLIDSGAVEAILKKGKSLLPLGVIEVEGVFDVGDAVLCKTEEGVEIAKGLTNYSASEMIKIKKVHSSKIEAILGYKSTDEVIHRDNLVVF